MVLYLIAKPVVAGPTPAELAEFCELIIPPLEPGERTFYTEWLGSTSPTAATARLHVNHVAEATLPCTVELLEKHPYASQIFLPLEASSYLVVVAPSLEDGLPDLAGVQAFEVPGNVGILYRPGVWHAGATALGGKAHFAVYMWRNDVDDDVFVELEEAIEITRGEALEEDDWGSGDRAVCPSHA